MVASDVSRMLGNQLVAAAISAGSSSGTAPSTRASTAGTCASRRSSPASAPTSLDRFDDDRETCWIAERRGANVGCVFLVQARDDITGAVLSEAAQLRMLLVEPAARGAGIGARLVAECERFARAKGYRLIVLWTHSILVSARAIYDRAGYIKTASEPHLSFGKQLVGETWEKPLDQGKPEERHRDDRRRQNAP